MDEVDGLHCFRWGSSWRSLCKWAVCGLLSLLIPDCATASDALCVRLSNPSVCIAMGYISTPRWLETDGAYDLTGLHRLLQPTPYCGSEAEVLQFMVSFSAAINICGSTPSQTNVGTYSEVIANKGVASTNIEDSDPPETRPPASVTFIVEEFGTTYTWSPVNNPYNSPTNCYGTTNIHDSLNRLHQSVGAQ